MEQYAVIASLVAFALGVALAVALRAWQSRRAPGARAEAQLVGDNLPNVWLGQVLLRPDGTLGLQQISAGIERLTGYSVEQLRDTPSLLYSSLDDESRALLEEAAVHAIEHMTPFEVEVRLLTASGEARWVQMSAAPRPQPDGAILWDGVQIDLTARKRAEEALRANESAYRALAFEHSRLYAEARRRAEELETLREAGATVAATLDIHEAIGRILEQLARVVPHDSASVQLRHGDNSEVIGCRGFPRPELIIGLRFNIFDNALCQAVYEQRQPMVVGETADAEGFVHVPGGPIRSWLALPLTAGDHVIGMLALDSATPKHFTLEHARLGMAFATQVAIALKHAQSYRREVQGRQRLMALQQATRQIAAHRTVPSELYTAVHHATQQLMTADGFAIMLFDLSDDEVHDVYLAYRGQLYPGESYPRHDSFAEFVVARGQSLLIDDFHSFDEYPLDVFSPEDDTRSGLAVLLRGSARVLGVIFAQSDRVGAYGEEDAVLLELLAAHAATALENGALFAEVERLATTDALTGIANRRHFFSQARVAAHRAHRARQPIAVALLDLDHFKQVNDTYGHQAGDLVLQVVAQTCRDCLRSGDLLGRYGGEELAVLMPNTDAQGATRVAERIRRAIAGLHISSGADEIRVTASLGVASDAQSYDLEVLLGRADAALYAAKDAGRNNVIACSACQSEGLGTQFAT